MQLGSDAAADEYFLGRYLLSAVGFLFRCLAVLNPGCGAARDARCLQIDKNVARAGMAGADFGAIFAFGNVGLFVLFRDAG